MSIKLYHYTVDKEDGLWDCISESFSEGALKKDLKGKDIFDWCVKQSFEKGAPYLGAVKKERKYGFYLSRWKRTYDRYFSKDMKLEDFLSKRVRDRFEPEKTVKNTSGNEFSSGKFYSVASSSRFAVASFTKKKGGKLDSIESITTDGSNEEVVVPEFEHDTPVTGIKENSRCPQMDFFFKTKTGKTVFIEAKNHEIMDSHKSIELRASYKDTDAFKALGLQGKTYERKYSDNKGNVHQYISLIHDNDDKKHFLQASDFGCKLKTFHFDFKQFLCHLMGIWSYAQNNPSEEIYFYYLIYNRLYEGTYGGNLYKELEAEVKTIFDVFGKRFPKIHFGLCYHDKYDTLRKLNAV